MWSNAKDDELTRNMCFYHDNRPMDAYEAVVKCSLDGGRLASTNQAEQLKVFSSHSRSQPVWLGKVFSKYGVQNVLINQNFRLPRKSKKRF